MSRGWQRVLELNRSRPALFNAVTDGTIYLGVANCLRGTAEGADYFDRPGRGDGHTRRRAASARSTDERYRLVFVGVPCYPIFRRFNEMFTEWGGTFVNSTYLWFASGGAHARVQSTTWRDPFESLAEGLLIVGARDAMDSMFFQDRASLAIDRRHIDVDGVVFHPIKSCRTVSTGLADARRALMASRRHPEPVHRVRHDGPARRLAKRSSRTGSTRSSKDGFAASTPHEVSALTDTGEEAAEAWFR